MQNRMVKRIRADITCLGPAFLLPIAALILVGGGLMLFARNNQIDIGVLMLAYEAVLGPVAAWWSIFLLVPMLEEPGGELFFTYPTSRFYYGVVRCLSFGLFYGVLLALQIALLANILVFPPSGLILQMIMESLFFAGLGFLAMVLTRAANYALVVVVGYDLAMILVYRFLPEWIDIFTHSQDILLFAVYIRFVLPKILIQVCLVWWLAQYLLCKQDSWSKY